MSVPLKALQRQLTALVDDLRRQSEALPEMEVWLREQYKAAYAARRTGGTYESWREEQLDLAGVAWLLGTVFVRFCEDNHLVNGVWIGGPDGGVDAAVQAKTAYFQERFRDNDRHWLRAAFTHLRGLRATAGLFDDHNPVWRFDISADAAGALLDFWQRGEGLASFHSLDTRFLGDLYQDLSQAARKRYALLQTPEFVEEFILNLTLDESLKEYGLAETSLIDPTCGSGHFLLGAFRRLHARWLREAPGMDRRERVQTALDQVTGVDINPFAVAIARFRLMVEAMQACGETSLEHAPGFRIRVATGDSLLKWGHGESSHQGDALAVLETGEAFAYFTEDGELLADYLRPGQYTVAVGNPPYITVKDKVLNEEYRQLYESCAGLYSLSVPFVERFFELVKQQDEGGRAGFVGQITAKSFTKRDFGKKLVERYLTTRVDLSHVVDAGGAYIPGHGTPTVILAGRRRRPRLRVVRAVFGLRGEPTAPREPSKGMVWHSIVSCIDKPNVSNHYVSVADVPREYFATHPWSLSGENSDGVVETMDAGSTRLRENSTRMGFFGMTHADDLYILPARLAKRHALCEQMREVISGDGIRDWSTESTDVAFFPYDHNHKLLDETDLSPAAARWFWPFRSVLWARTRFGGQTYRDDNIPWFAWHQVPVDHGASQWSLVYAFVATHNHVTLDRSDRAFRQSAPLIRLSQDVTEDERFLLLGLLNSSAACFWLKQMNHDMGGGGIGGGLATEDWEHFYQFNATRFAKFPLPNKTSVEVARRLDKLARRLAAVLPSKICESRTPSREELDKARTDHETVRAEMIMAQEELDWVVYGLYELIDEVIIAHEDAPARLMLGERAFEILLARDASNGKSETEWFSRHGSTLNTGLPPYWSASYKALVERRIKIIEERPDIALIERPECKRRWAAKSWEVQEQAALRDWLLDRLEAEHLWRDNTRARVLSVAQLADRIGTDADFRSVLSLYCGRDDYDLTAELTKLTADEAVPFLATYRYKPSGLVKRKQWEETWDRQRREDAGEKLDPIPVPPKYKSEDFARKSYWDNRGKLDVPKERFIAYPKAGRDTDRTPVLGWAGWDHLDQAQALATLYYDRKTNDAWKEERLLPLLAGLVELEPWLHQWYSEPAPGYASGPAAFYTRVVIDTELAALGRGRSDLTAEKLT